MSHDKPLLFADDATRLAWWKEYCRKKHLDKSQAPLLMQASDKEDEGILSEMEQACKKVRL